MSRMGLIPTTFATSGSTVAPAMFDVPSFYVAGRFTGPRQFPMNPPGMREAVDYLRSLKRASNCSLGSSRAVCREIDFYLSVALRLLLRLQRSLGALALQSNPAHYGASEEVKKGLAGVGAAGFGIAGAIVGALVGSSLPFKDGAAIGGILGFMIPVILVSPKSEEAA